MRTKNGAGVRASNTGPNPAELSLRPDHSIRPEIPKDFQSRPLFQSAEEYREVAAKLDRLAFNYQGVKWPEEGAVRETMAMAGIADRDQKLRVAFLILAAQCAVITADQA